MRCECIFRHISKSSLLENYAEEKFTREIFERFEAFSRARVIFSREGRKVSVRCCLYRDQEASLMMQDSKEDGYAAIDGVIKKLTAEMKEHADGVFFIPQALGQPSNQKESGALDQTTKAIRFRSANSFG